MRNRDGSESNGYMGSPDMLEDWEAYGPRCWIPLSHGLAKEFGTLFFLRNWLEHIIKVIYLRIKIRNYYYLENKVKNNGP